MILQMIGKLIRTCQYDTMGFLPNRHTVRSKNTEREIVIREIEIKDWVRTILMYFVFLVSCCVLLLMRCVVVCDKFEYR